MLTKEDVTRIRALGKLAERFESHIDALANFLGAASGAPRFTEAPDNCCDRCGAPDRGFRRHLRLLAYSERE